MSVKSRTGGIEYWLPCRTCVNQPIVCDRIIGNQPIALVLDYPTHLEARRGKLLEGDTGRLIKATLTNVGIDEGSVSFLTALNCKPDTSKPKLLRESMACCRARLLRELRSLDVDKVLCLGTLGYTALTSTDKIARMDKVHGRWMPVYGMQMMGTYSPTRVILDPELYRDFSRAFHKFFTTDGREPWPDVRYVIPESHLKLYSELEDIGAWNTDTLLSCDIETTGFNPTEDDIIAVGFSNVDGDVVIIDINMLDDKSTWMLIAGQLELGWTSFHNGKFDLKHLNHKFSELGIDVILGKIEDTMLLNYCLDERPWGKYGAHSLKNISRVRYDAPDYDIDVGKWLKEWKDPETTDERKREMLDELHRYLALDCYYTARLTPDLRSEVEAESKKLLDFYEWLLIPASNALSDIELRGCKLNREYLEDIQIELVKELKESTRKIREYADNLEFNPGSTKQVHTLLYKQLGLPVVKLPKHGKKQEGPTSKAAIHVLQHRYPKHKDLLTELLNWRRVQKTLGTYVLGWLDRVDNDDRIRCDYLQHGTVTGRISSINPNLQNIPDESHIKIDVKHAIIPEGPDWLLLEADYSQLELRVCAHLTNDDNLIQVYVDDGDLHKDMSDAFFKKQTITPYERAMSKGMVFGAMYDRSAQAIATGPEMDYLANELGGDRWTLQQVERFFVSFFRRYPKLAVWQKSQKQQAYRNQVIETEFGRLRRFPLLTRHDGGTVGRQAINSPIQSLASDITLDALVRLHERFKRINYKAGEIVVHIILTIHDSIVIEVHKDYLNKVKRIVQEEMALVPLDTNVPFKAKIAVGENWSACK